MPTITVRVPDDLKQRMDALSDVNWSAVARRSFEDRVKLWELLEKAAEQSTMTEKMPYN